MGLADLLGGNSSQWSPTFDWQGCPVNVCTGHNQLDRQPIV
jgi:hypothetical protein